MKKQRLIPAFVLLAALLSLTFAAVGCGGKPEKFTVTANKPDHGVVQISDANPVKGANVAITAHADDEYTIDVFKVNGADVAYSAQGTGVFKYTIENISENAVVEVKFKAAAHLSVTGITVVGTPTQGANTIYSSDDDAKLKSKLSGFTIEATFSDSTADTVAVSACVLSVTNAATGEITVTYGGQTATFNVTVTPVALSGITAAWITSQTIDVFDNWSMAKLKTEIGSLITVTGTNNDGSAYDGGAAITGYDLTGTLTPGAISVTVSYGGKTTVLPVNVTLYGQTGIQLYSAPDLVGLVIYTDVTSSALKSALQSKLTVQKVYSDASVENLSPSGYTLTLDPAVGEVTLTQDDSSFSLTFMIELTLLAPANITKNGNAITWTSVAYADEYAVKIYNKSGGPALVNTVVLAAAYTITARNLEIGAPYIIEVRAQSVDSVFIPSAAAEQAFNGEIVYDFSLGTDANPFTSIGSVDPVWCDKGSATIAYNGTAKRIDVTLTNTASTGSAGAPIAYIDFKPSIPAKTMIAFDVDMTFPAGAMTTYITFKIYDKGSMNDWGDNGGYEYRVYPATGNNWPGPQRIQAYLPVATNNTYLLIDTTGITTTGTRILHINRVTLGSTLTMDFTQSGDQHFFGYGGGTNVGDGWAGGGSMTHNQAQGRLEFAINAQDLSYVNYTWPVKAGMVVTFEVDIVFTSPMTGPAYFSIQTGNPETNILGGYWDRTISYKVQPLNNSWPGTQRISAALTVGASGRVSLMVDLGQTGAKNGAVIRVLSFTLSAPKSGYDVSKFTNLNHIAGTGSAPWTDGGGNRAAQIMPDGDGAMVHILEGAQAAYLDYEQSVTAGDIISVTLMAEFSNCATAQNINIEIWGNPGNVRFGGRTVEFTAGNRQTVTVTATESKSTIFVKIYVNGITGSCMFYIRDLSITAPPPEFDDMGFNIPDYSASIGVLGLDIGTWEAPARGDMTQNGFNMVKAAGFSMLYPTADQCDFGNDYGKATTYLGMAETANLRVVVNDSEFVTRGLQTHVSRYRDSGAFGGINVKDEPTATELSSVAATVKSIKDSFPGWLCYVNFDHAANINTKPSGAVYNKYDINTAEWNDGYVQAYFNALNAAQAGLKPDILAFDNYVLLDGSTRNNKYAQHGGDQRNSVKNAYLSEMAYIAYKAQANGIMPQCHLLTSGHYVGGAAVSQGVGWSYKNVTETDLRWQITVAMAYGYQSFNHYTYDSDKTGSAGSEGNYQLLIAPNGTPNSLYYSVKNVNLEARAWEHVYMNYNWLGTAPVKGASGNNKWFNNIDDAIHGSNKMKDGLSGISVSSNQDVLVGMFEDKNNPGQNGFMLTNATLPSDNRTATVTVSGFGGSYGAVLVYTNGVPEVKVLSGGSVTLTILPGQGQFVIPLIAK